MPNPLNVWRSRPRIKWNYLSPRKWRFSRYHFRIDPHLVSRQALSVKGLEGFTAIPSGPPVPVFSCFFPSRFRHGHCCPHNSLHPPSNLGPGIFSPLWTNLIFPQPLCKNDLMGEEQKIKSILNSFRGRQEKRKRVGGRIPDSLSMGR